MLFQPPFRVAVDEPISALRQAVHCMCGMVVRVLRAVVQVQQGTNSNRNSDESNVSKFSAEKLSLTEIDVRSAIETDRGKRTGRRATTSRIPN